MTPVIQTITEMGKGNCLAACIASILEISIDEIPDLKCGTDFVAMERCLRRYSIVPIWISGPGLKNSYTGQTPEYCIIIGASPRDPSVNHAVVGKPDGYGYKIVHDPHPEGVGLDGPVISVIYFGAIQSGAWHRSHVFPKEYETVEVLVYGNAMVKSLGKRIGFVDIIYGFHDGESWRACDERTKIICCEAWRYRTPLSPPDWIKQ